MIFRNIHKKSLLPKSLIIAAMATSISISFCILFIEKNNLVFWLQPYKVVGDLYRNIFLFVCFFVYFIRLVTTLLVFFQRKMYWIEAIVIANIMPFIFPYVAFIGGGNTQHIYFIEIIGCIFFIFGSYLNTRSEYLRYVWKKKNENKGHIYTGGLFRYAIHINYLGDIILFLGIALVANHLVLLIIPGSMAFIFVVILIPLKENYLKDKYGNEFNNYKANTKKLIPLIY